MPAVESATGAADVWPADPAVRGPGESGGSARSPSSQLFACLKAAIGKQNKWDSDINVYVLEGKVLLNT